MCGTIPTERMSMLECYDEAQLYSSVISISDTAEVSRFSRQVRCGQTPRRFRSTKTTALQIS
jgi:hypothetical protein